MGCPVMDPTVVSPAHHFPARPRLAASCSPSRSPSRRKRFTTEELNPLLSDLSPTFTLEVLYASDTVRTGGTAAKNFVQESVASASTSEKAWGIKAALAGKKVREWYAEVGGWPWPGFDRAPINQLTKRTDQYHDGHIDSTLSAETIRSNGSGNEHYTVGKLPLKLVQEYEERIEMIRHDVATLEIEDLKDYVLNTRFRAGSRRSSLYNSQASFAIATEYDNLDDFTTIITATIIQALPTISRLETLLGIWSTRLLVLREVPSFLTDLDDGRESMMSASIAIGGHSSQQLKQRSDFSPKAFSDIRVVLKDQIAELGRRLDRMLDLLESSVDTLPDAWVDGLDNIENEYSAWVVKAERLATNNELGTGRLEKDYTQDQADDQMGLERPLDIQHTTSTLNIGTQFDEISRRADSEFDMTPQSQKDTLRSKNVATGSSTIHGAGPFDLAPVPSKNALAERSLSDKAQSQGPVVNTIDTQSWNGLSDVSKTSVLPSRLTHRPTPLILAASRVDEKTSDLPDAASDTSGSGSANSSYSSNKPSPEIQSAVVAEYLGSPVTVTSPTMLNREPMTPLDISLRGFGQLAEGDGFKTDQSYIPVDHLPKNERRNGGSGHVRTRSASRRSFEIVPKHEIRKIQIKRSGSYSSALSLSDPSCGQVQPSRFPVPSAPQHGEPVALGSTAPLSASKEVEDQPPPALVQNRDPGHGGFEHHPLYHSPPPVSVKSSASAKSSDLDFRTPKQKLPYHLPPVVAPGPAKSAQSLDRKLDTAGHRTPYHSPPPIIPRSAHRFQQVSDLSPGSTPVIIRKTKLGEPTSSHVSGHVEAPRTVARSSPGNFDSQLEERISSILTELPTHIRLASGPEPDAPEVMRFNSPSDPKVPKTRSPAWRLKRTQTSTPLPSMTLAPQQPKSSKSQSVTGEPDIRLYHLHQAGKTAPIKLFVRLVGEDGERVMVRIGGGWADLGEYLREYANHHGQRSVSDSPFNIQGLPSSPVTNQSSPRSRPGSRPASRPASRPVSPTSANKLSPATFFQRQQTSPAIFPSPHTPQSDPSARPSACVSWAGVDEVSPSLGLAGPKTKNVDISPSKQAWVDEMMAQARQSGGEKKGGGENAVGDLGKVGSTKRVFFKGRKEG